MLQQCKMCLLRKCARSANIWLSGEVKQLLAQISHVFAHVHSKMVHVMWIACQSFHSWRFCNVLFNPSTLNPSVF